MTVKRRAKGALLVSVLAAVVVVLSIGGMPSIEALPNRVARQTHEHRRVLTGDNIFARKKDSEEWYQEGRQEEWWQEEQACSSLDFYAQTNAETSPKANAKANEQTTGSSQIIYGMTTSSPTCLECDEAYLYESRKVTSSDESISEH